MKKIKITECPFCGGKKFFTVCQGLYGRVYWVKSPLKIKTADLYHRVCCQCGSVVRSYLKEIDKFIDKTNQR